MPSQTPMHRSVAIQRYGWSVTRDDSWVRILQNKVPEVTVLFWVVKILSTTVGETAADFLSGNLGLGLSATTAIMSLLFVAVLIGQVSTRRYVPGIYWLALVLVGVVGTLLSDNLVEGLGVSRWASTAAFVVCLALAFSCWYRSEHTVSIHTIVTRRREAFYWLAILFTFALGTSAGDLISEKLALGYPAAALIFGSVVAMITIAYFGFELDAVLGFWAAYVMTRPFSGAVGDYLAASAKDGGLGLGANATSALFAFVIIAAVVWFTLRARRGDRAFENARTP